MSSAGVTYRNMGKDYLEKHGQLTNFCDADEDVSSSLATINYNQGGMELCGPCPPATQLPVNSQRGNGVCELLLFHFRVLAGPVLCR